MPGYIDVTQTVIIILIMAGLFPDRPHITLSIKLFVHFASLLLRTFALKIQNGTVAYSFLFS